MHENEYRLTFNEAVEKCLINNEFIVGEQFKPGHYAKNSEDVIILMEINENGIHKPLWNLMISKGLLSQKFKTVTCATADTLGLGK